MRSSSKSSSRKLVKKPREVSQLSSLTNTLSSAIQTIEGQIHDENQSLTLKTISQRYKLEKQKREIEEQKEVNRKIKRDIAINQGTEEQYSQRAAL